MYLVKEPVLSLMAESLSGFMGGKSCGQQVFCFHSTRKISNPFYREFVEKHLPSFKSKNPQLEVETQLNPGHHPYLKGFYVNKRDRIVGVKNESSEDILLQATRLRSCLGRKVVKLRSRVLTLYPSVQGTWKPDTQF